MTHPNVTLTAEQADEVADTLIELATRLPLKHRTHESALLVLGWFDRRTADARDHKQEAH